MLGNPSERNLKQIINGGENPMHTPVDNHDQAEDPVTHRVTCRQTNTTEQRPEAAPFITLMGSDSMDTSIEHNHNAPGAEPVRRRHSRRQLEELLPSLKERDLQILAAIRQCRFFTSKQVCRLIFLGQKPSIANTRAINRNLKKLRELSLIDANDEVQAALSDARQRRRRTEAVRQEEQRLVREMAPLVGKEAAETYGKLNSAQARAFEAAYGVDAAGLMRRRSVMLGEEGEAEGQTFSQQGTLPSRFADMPLIEADSTQWFGPGKAIDADSRNMRKAVHDWARTAFPQGTTVANADTGWIKDAASVSMADASTVTGDITMAEVNTGVTMDHATLQGSIIDAIGFLPIMECLCVVIGVDIGALQSIAYIHPHIPIVIWTHLRLRLIKPE